MAWRDEGVSIRCELSTAGDIVDKSNTIYIDFIDANGDGIGDKWRKGPGGDNMGTINRSVANNVQQNQYATWPSSATTVRGDLYWDYTGIQAGKQYRLDVSYAKYPGATGPTKTHTTISYWSFNAAGQSLDFANVVVDPDTQTAWSNNSFTFTIDVNAVKFTLGISMYATNADGVAGNIFGTTFSDISLTLVQAITPTFTWRDISCDVKEIQVRHGRSRFTERFDVGTLQLSLDNQDGDYTYAVDHPFGFRPGRLVKLNAVRHNTSYPMFYGVIDTIKDSYGLDGKHITVLTCYDVTTVASNTLVPTITAAKNTQSGVRVNTLLDIVGYYNRYVETGIFLQQPITGSGRTVRDEIGVGSDSEGGATWGDRSGRYIFRDRNWWTTDPRLIQVQAEIMATPFENVFFPVDPVTVNPNAPTICANELNTDWSLAYVINIVSLANRGGSQQTFTDPDSIAAHGPQTHSRTDFINVSSSTLATRANDYLTGNSEAVLRLNALSYRAQGLDDKGWVYTFNVFMGWMLRVTFQSLSDYWGWQIVTHVQSVTHSITPLDWTVSFEVDQPKSFNEFSIRPTDNGWDGGQWDIALWDEVGQEAAYWSSGELWSDTNSRWN